MNQWNELADIFACDSSSDAIPEYAADNICIAWPSIIAGMEKAFADSDRAQRLRVLDYGCGGGLFCRKLHTMGHVVAGYDNARELIKKARENVPAGVYVTDSDDVLKHHAVYDVIASVMVFQFIENIEQTIAGLLPTLKSDGLVIYAVFNPEFVYDNSAKNDAGLFSPVSDQADGTACSTMALKQGIRIPFYIRTQDDYRALFARYGMQEVYLDYPAFSPEFLREYNMRCSTKQPEFLIQAFRRVSSAS